MIETKRLVLKPLTYEQLVKYIRCDHSLEEELGLEETSRTISEELREALENTILPHVADKSRNYLFHTLWTGICKMEHKMIGDLCIIGEPDADGKIEIGYGTYDKFQGQGYMTEMVGGLIAWAKTESSIKCITATTDQSNVASGKVLQKNNFVLTVEIETTRHWTLQIR